MKILQDSIGKIKALSRGDWTAVLVVILVASLAFLLGRLSAIYEERGGLKIEYPSASEESVVGEVLGASSSELTPETSNLEPLSEGGGPREIGEAAISRGGGYVASKTGSKYFLPWCGSASSIKEENRVYFASKAEAEAAGYTPAANCKGI